MAISKTVIKFVNNDAIIELTGDRSVDSLRETFKGAFPYVTNGSVTTAVNGTTKTVTFAERSGDKGVN